MINASATPPPKTLPRGLHSYEDLVAACRRGEYRFAATRAASGRLNYLLGIDPLQWSLLRRQATERRTGFIVIGSRVSGPRLRQKSLHPALAASLPLKTYRRHASAIFPGAEDIEIDKTAIKELGLADPRTSDLSVLLVDSRRTTEEMDALAITLEDYFSRQGWSFPVRVFAHFDGRYHRSESDFLATGEVYLRSLLKTHNGGTFSTKDLHNALSELYCTVNLPRRLFSWADIGNGLVDAVLFSASFSMGLGYHDALPFLGFFFGLIGRYLARLRAWVAFHLGDGLYANAGAMAFDAALGFTIMAGLIVPTTGLHLRLGAIATGSLSHTLSKGALRLFIDKKFSVARESSQALGVLISIVVNFAQGTVTSFVYSGSKSALALQCGMAALGAFLLFGPIISRKTKAQQRP